MEYWNVLLNDIIFWKSTQDGKCLDYQLVEYWNGFVKWYNFLQIYPWWKVFRLSLGGVLKFEFCIFFKNHINFIKAKGGELENELPNNFINDHIIWSIILLSFLGG